MRKSERASERERERESKRELAVCIRSRTETFLLHPSLRVRARREERAER